MLKAERPNADARRIRSEADARLYAAGIPSQYWKAANTPTFDPFKLYTDDAIISQETQAEFYASLIGDNPVIFTQPYLVYVTAMKNENTAMAVAFEIIKAAYRHMPIQVDNAAGFDRRPDVLEPAALLMNTAWPASLERREATRDWIKQYQPSFRVVVVFGDITEFTEGVGIRPSIAFSINHVSGRVRA